MSIISNELTSKYSQDKYPMSTGSDEWREMKGEYEMIDDTIVGTIMYNDMGSVVIDEVGKFKFNLENFRFKIDNYKPKDDDEINEKNILQNKIEIGLEIYRLILADLNNK